MKNQKRTASFGSTLEQYRIVSAYGSLFRMHVFSGQTWILSDKELMWRKVAEENGTKSTVPSI